MTHRHTPTSCSHQLTVPHCQQRCIGRSGGGVGGVTGADGVDGADGADVRSRDWITILRHFMISLSDPLPIWRRRFCTLTAKPAA
jgi:hypothetical protein